MADAPAGVVEKYYGLRTHYIEVGKEFDSKKIKPYVRQVFMDKGWPTGHPDFAVLDSFPDEVIGVSAERARQIRMDDRDAKKELEEAMRVANAAVASRANAVATGQAIDGRIATLEEQLAAAQAEIEAMRSRAAPAIEPPAVEGGSSPSLDPPPATSPVAREGEPTAEWSKKDILAFADSKDVKLTTHQRNFGSKAELVETILGALEKAP